MTADDRWAKPSPTTDLDLAFPARGPELTPVDDVPDDSEWARGEWEPLVNGLFAGTIDGPSLSLLPAGDIDAREAWDHLQVVLGTFGTKHEHKIRGAAWLFSRWFEAAIWTERRGHPCQAGDPGAIEALRIVDEDEGAST